MNTIKQKISEPLKKELLQIYETKKIVLMLR